MAERISKDEYVRIAALRRALLRFLNFSKQATDAAGLTPRQHQMLLCIKGRRERDWVTVSEIAEYLQIRHNAAVGLVNRGVEADLVRKVPDPGDGRTIRVYLTAKGEAILEQLTKVHLHEMRTLARVLAEEVTVLTTTDRQPYSDLLDVH